MSAPEKRKHPRVNFYYPISYVCTDGNGCVMQQSMGVALNISQSGILIETAESVFCKHIGLISVDLNKNIIEISGKVSYCKKNGSEKYRIGIRFEATYAQRMDFVKRLIRAYYYNKDKNCYRSVSKPKAAVI